MSVNTTASPARSTRSMARVAAAITPTTEPRREESGVTTPRTTTQAGQPGTSHEGNPVGAGPETQAMYGADDEDNSDIDTNAVYSSRCDKCAGWISCHIVSITNVEIFFKNLYLISHINHHCFGIIPAQ